MSFVSTIIGTAERVPLPDVIIRAAIHRLCSRTATRLATGNAESDAWFADEMAARAIAEYTDEANAQDYEVPAAFFAHVLGPNRKYSACFYKEPASTLQEAEEEALRQTVEHAEIADGRPGSHRSRPLDLGLPDGQRQSLRRSTTSPVGETLSSHSTPSFRYSTS
jgi:cyclopropane-fatty-acyl-phospholipid synthase